MAFKLYHQNCIIIKCQNAIQGGLPVEKGMRDACVAQLVRAIDRQSKDPGSNPGTVESVSFSRERFLFIWKLYLGHFFLSCSNSDEIIYILKFNERLEKQLLNVDKYENIFRNSFLCPNCYSDQSNLTWTYVHFRATLWVISHGHFGQDVVKSII